MKIQIKLIVVLIFVYLKTIIIVMFNIIGLLHQYTVKKNVKMNKF